ncbi:MAG: endonuclease NucS, partial [Sulfurimonas sp.]|nr:endonuclease NucS [Sulfurimonas sp.]
MNENTIREKLFSRLSTCFPNLTPLSQEVYLKIGNKKSFIDILAQDEDNNYVIIELKRTNQASRQALHEIFKYTEFVKKNYAVNDESIKIMIVSTTWDELLIPYSKFVSKNTFFDIKGIKLVVDTNGNCISHKEVKTLNINDELFFSPAQIYTFYNNKLSLDKGLQSYINLMKNKDIQDYLLIILKNSEQTIEYDENFEYIIYFIMLRKTKEEYEKILDIINDDETTYLAHRDFYKFGLSSYEKAINLSSLPYSDDLTKNAKPLNLDTLIYKELWEIIEIKRYGRLENNILPDEILLKESLGFNGRGDMIYEDDIYLSETNKVNKLKEKSKFLLDNNEMFKNQFTIIIDNILSNNSQDTRVKVIIYNTTNILLSLYQELEFCKDSTAMTSLPFFQIEVDNTIYLGTLIWGKSKEYNFQETFNTIYSDGIDFFNKTQTSHIIENNDILEYLDLEYNTIKIHN